MGRQNPLYIHTHDSGRYIQPYGHSIPTPHLQRLADDGTLIRQNFCINLTCSPSREALLKDLWLEHDWKQQCGAEESLFDLMFDPNETNNLSPHLDHQAILHDMQERLKRWMKHTTGPILKGNLNPPDEAIVNDRDEISTKDSRRSPMNVP